VPGTPQDVRRAETCAEETENALQEHEGCMSIAAWWHFQRARWLTTFNRLEQAAAALKQVLAIDPAYPRAVSSLGYTYASLGRRSAALEQFRAALQIDPNDSTVLFDIGFVQQEMGQHEAALQSFGDAVRISPRLDRAWYGMGLSLRALGRDQEALQPFERAAELQPFNGFAFYELGMTYHALGRLEKVDEVLGHVAGFDPKIANKLAIDAGRAQTLAESR
jgi:tetratricopeptide (TPR) repeat protein